MLTQMFNGLKNLNDALLDIRNPVLFVPCFVITYKNFS